MTFACGCERVRWGVGNLSNNGRFWKPDASKHVYVWLDFNQCNCFPESRIWPSIYFQPWRLLVYITVQKYIIHVHSALQSLWVWLFNKAEKVIAVGFVDSKITNHVKSAQLISCNFKETRGLKFKIQRQEMFNVCIKQTNKQTNERLICVGSFLF